MSKCATENLILFSEKQETVSRSHKIFWSSFRSSRFCEALGGWVESVIGMAVRGKESWKCHVQNAYWCGVHCQNAGVEKQK